MTATATVSTTSARRPALDRTTAMRLAATEYDRFLTQLRGLRPEDWTKPTDCPGWDVRALVGHVVGMTEMSASLPEQFRQMRAAGKAGGEFIDALTALQVAKHAGDTTEQLVSRYAVVGPRAARARRHAPGFVRSRPMPDQQKVGSSRETWTYGYCIDVILTRDTWMHRLDVATAAGLALELDGEHDGVLVDDVVREWAGRHGQPCTVQLSGPAGGRWDFGSGGTAVSEDAVDFCRSLSGRGVPALGTYVPF
ncbi:MAG: maleylpyruvate isomerase family mycothiol-dependent enzyme [Mycobacteriales bacterium]